MDDDVEIVRKNMDHDDLHLRTMSRPLGVTREKTTLTLAEFYAPTPDISARDPPESDRLEEQDKGELQGSPDEMVLSPRSVRMRNEAVLLSAKSKGPERGDKPRARTPSPHASPTGSVLTSSPDQESQPDAGTVGISTVTIQVREKVTAPRSPSQDQLSPGQPSPVSDPASTASTRLPMRSCQRSAAKTASVHSTRTATQNVPSVSPRRVKSSSSVPVTVKIQQTLGIINLSPDGWHNGVGISRSPTVILRTSPHSLDQHHHQQSHYGGDTPSHNSPQGFYQRHTLTGRNGHTHNKPPPPPPAKPTHSRSALIALRRSSKLRAQAPANTTPRKGDMSGSTTNSDRETTTTQQATSNRPKAASNATIRYLGGVANSPSTVTSGVVSPRDVMTAHVRRPGGIPPRRHHHRRNTSAAAAGASEKSSGPRMNAKNDIGRGQIGGVRSQWTRESSNIWKHDIRIPVNSKFATVNARHRPNHVDNGVAMGMENISGNERKVKPEGTLQGHARERGILKDTSKSSTKKAKSAVCFKTTELPPSNSRSSKINELFVSVSDVPTLSLARERTRIALGNRRTDNKHGHR